MFITIDVVFHRDTMQYNSESKFQGKYRHIQNLTYDLPSKEGQFVKSKGHVEIVDYQNKESRDPIAKDSQIEMTSQEVNEEE